MEVDKLRDITEQELMTKTFGAPPEEPLLGHYYKLPKRPDRQDTIILNDSLQTVIVYICLRLPEIFLFSFFTPILLKGCELQFKIVQ